MGNAHCSFSVINFHLMAVMAHLRITIFSAVLCFQSVAAFTSSFRPVINRMQSPRPHLTSMAAATAAPFTLPPRVVMDQLPKVYVYDHCPFCVRVRLALGLKNVKYENVFMANDDVDTPTKLVGKKVAPVFELPQDSMVMGESLDIIEYVDKDPRFGKTGMFKPMTGRTDLKAWQKKFKSSGLSGNFQRPRYVLTPLPEFMTKDARDAFIKNHPVPPFEKAEWKADDFSQELRIEKFADALATSNGMMDELNEALKEMDAMIFSEHHCSEGGLCMDDIDLWSRLRSISIIKGAQVPPKMKAYMDNLAELGDVPLYWSMAV